MNKLGYGLVLSFLVLFTSASAEVSPDLITDIFQRLQKLEKTARELNGENEVLKHQLDQLKKDQKKGFLSIDERMENFSKPQGKSESAPSNKATPNKETSSSSNKDGTVKIVDYKPDPVADKKTEAPKAVEKTPPKKEALTTKASTEKTNTNASTKKKSRAPTAYEKETYQAAFSLMKTSPTAATKAFKEYIKMQPNSPLAANAQYWIAEIMYSHNNYKGAVKEFIIVLQKYKYSEKAPDAAIKLGYSFYALKNWAYARRTFEDVLKYFPENKNAVTLAQKRLDKMKVAGN